ncbi:MAG: hypothetical protein HY287_12300 [Planctomycetes bacterium]|nr:hypothetical protein [Planctomycetota bacterium]MBI3835102.1 hypothetical protein [Planctomycetota bacterium]
MRYQELVETLHRLPFEPFRLQLTNGQSHVVRHKDFAWVTRSTLYIGIPSGDDEVPDRAIQCDLLHVVAIEPVNGSPEQSNGNAKK